MQRCLRPCALSARLRGAAHTPEYSQFEALLTHYSAPLSWRSYSAQTDAQLIGTAVRLESAREVGGDSEPVQAHQTGKAYPPKEKLDALDYILDGYEALSDAPKEARSTRLGSSVRTQSSGSRTPVVTRTTWLSDRKSWQRTQDGRTLRDPKYTGGKSTTTKPRALQPQVNQSPPAPLRGFLQTKAKSGHKGTRTAPVKSSYTLTQSKSIERRMEAYYAMPVVWSTRGDKRVAPISSPWARSPVSKYITLQTSSASTDAFDTSWNMNYARVHAPYDAVHISDARERGLDVYANTTPVLSVHAFEWVEAVQSRLSAQQTLDLTILAQQYNVQKKVVWANAVLWLLRYDKMPPTDFLKATCGDGELPASWVLDTLTLAAIKCGSFHKDHRHQFMVTIAEAFIAFASRENADRVNLFGPLVRHLLHYCDREQIPSIYRALKTGKFRVGWYTYLQAATRLAQTDHFDQGLDALLEAHHVGNIDSSAFRSVCATLFRRAMKQPGGLRVCLRMVDNLVKVGLRLNTRLCNVLILNAVEAGDLKTAHAIYESLIENDVEADVYTYAILLKGCKQNPEDSETLSRVIRSALGDKNVVMNPILGTEILHCLVLHHGTQWTKGKEGTEGQEPGEGTWPIICQAYCQLFDTTPLEELGIPMSSPPQSSPTTREPMPAPVQAVGIMVNTYLQLHSKLFAPAENAYAIYKAYHTLAADRIPPFADLARSDHTANSFLMAFNLSKRTLVHAAEVVKDMQSAAAASSGAGPTIVTWSIFLRGFTQHRQLKLAEQVLSYMRSRNIKPNQVTWITLAKGYALAQDVDGMVDAMSRAEAEDLAWDDWSKGGLRRLRDQSGFLAKWERTTTSAKIDFTEDLKAGLRERLARAGSVAPANLHTSSRTF